MANAQIQMRFASSSGRVLGEANLDAYHHAEAWLATQPWSAGAPWASDRDADRERRHPAEGAEQHEAARRSSSPSADARFLSRVLIPAKNSTTAYSTTVRT